MCTNFDTKDFNASTQRLTSSDKNTICNTFMCLNIDGVKSNFDLFVASLLKIKPCGKNITEDELKLFQIEAHVSVVQ